MPLPLTPTIPTRSPGPSRQVTCSRRERRLPAAAHRERDVLQLDHGLAQPGGRQLGQLDAVAGRRLGRDERGGRVHPELRLGGPGPGPALQPGELLAGQVAAAALGRFLAALPFRLREHVSRVAALGGMHLAPVDLPGPIADGVQQPAIVADHDDRAGPVAQVPAEPVDRLDVQVVGRLVEQQHVTLGDQQGGERDPAAFAAGQLPGCRVQADAGEQFGHDRPRPRIRLPGSDLRTARAEHDLCDRSGQLVTLWQVAEPQPGRHRHPAGVGLGQPGQQREQRGLAGPVAAHHPDPVPGRDPERHAVEEGPVGVRLGRLLQADQVHRRGGR